MSPRPDSSEPDYLSMAELRHQIRRFLRSSEDAARGAGLKPQQYQMLLAIKGLPGDSKGRISEVADRLQIQHHSTVELADRLAARGLLRRKRTGEDRREVMLELTLRGEKILRELALNHRDELRDAGPALVAALKKVLAWAGKDSRRSKGRRESMDR